MKEISLAMKKNGTQKVFDTSIMIMAGSGRHATITDAFELIVRSGARQHNDDTADFIPLLEELQVLVADAMVRNATKYGESDNDNQFAAELYRVIRKNIRAFKPVLRESELRTLEAADVASATELRHVAALYTGDKKSRAPFRKAAKNPRIFRAVTKSTQELICDAAKNAYDDFGNDLFKEAAKALKREAERLEAIEAAQAAADNE